jgi:small subunit ribosomal protein S17
MADEETPDTSEETAAAPEGAEPEAEVTTPDAAEPEEAAKVAGESAPVVGPSKREQRATAKQTAASSRAPRTPEERQAERDAERNRKAEQRRRRRVKEREKAKAKPTVSAGEQLAVHEPTTGRPKVRVGKVVSDKADQTITVRIDIARRHRRYEKIVRSSSTLHAHDPANDAHEGDLVRVVESRPLSKTKRWRLVEVLERAR